LRVTKILLVEDNEMNRDMLSRRLEKRGFEVAMAVDGKQGLEMASSESLRLILLDMSLPVMDGWEVARHLKEDPATASVPIIALTAHAMAGDREKAIEAGCDDYDTKPISERSRPCLPADLRSSPARAASVGSMAATRR
jgi:two-component system cell cycle response regulator DivK